MSEFKIQTAQNITINQNLAGIGERIMAVILDGFFLTVFYIAVIYLLNISGISDRFSGWAFGAVLMLPYFLYYPLLQYWHNGQTLGKQVMKIRVVKIDNSHPSIGDFLIRWILRVFELNIIPLGIIVMLLNDKKQRLGDIAAKTTVVSEKQKVNLSQSIFEDIDKTYQPTFPNVQSLKDEDVQLIKIVFREAKERKNRQVLAKLTNKVEALLDIKRPENMKYVDFIDMILKDYNYYANL